MVNELIVKERVRELLLDAGVNGLKQTLITGPLHHDLPASELLLILERWRLVGAVQKFRIDDVPFRPITIWRATHLLAETTEDGEEYVY